MKQTYEVITIPLHMLKPHEEVIEEHVEELVEEIKKQRCIHKPIIVDKHSFVILDGHHRYTAALRLGLSTIPCVVVDYDDETIVTLEFWRENIQLTKEEVVRAGMEGRRFPPKTTKHTILVTCEYSPTHVATLQ